MGTRRRWARAVVAAEMEAAAGWGWAEQADWDLVMEADWGLEAAADLGWVAAAGWD